MLYTIPYEPTPLSSLRLNRGKGWDTSKQTEFNVRNTLHNQHHPKILYASPIIIDITFYLPHKNKNYREPDPDLIDLIRFIEEMAIGALWNNTRIIKTMAARKTYSKTPHTIIDIQEAL